MRFPVYKVAMRARAILLGVFVLTIGCGSKGAEEKKQKAPLPAFTGPLTIAKVVEADGMVKPFDEWEPALEELESKLGKATRVDKNKYGWAVIEGDDCAYFVVEKDERSKYQQGKTGFMVGTTEGPMKLGKDGAIFNVAECREMAGETVGPKEDPSVPGPPEDGTAVDLRTFLDRVFVARSKWENRRVRVTAQLLNTNVSTWTSGGESGQSVSAVLVVGEGKTDPSVTCDFPKGRPLPESATQYSPVVAIGKVRIAKWTSLAGTSGLSASLEDCELMILPKPQAGSSAAPKPKKPPANE